MAAFAVISLAYADDVITENTFYEYSEVAGFEKQYNQMINIFVSNFQNGMLQGLNNSLEEKEISEDLRRKITPVARQSAENLRIQFEHLFKNAVKFRDLVDDVYLPTYRKHFTEREMIELINFYKSPVGKKLSALTPTIMQESSTTFNQVYGLRVQELRGDLVKKEMDSLSEKVKSLQSNR